MQPVDLTTLMATCAELRSHWLPAKLEQVYQRDRHRICLALRTIKGRGWLTICWHPQAARICMGNPPPKIPDTFTFSDQLRHQLNGLALVAIEPVAPWERAIALQFAKRPGDVVLWYLYVEIMGKYSNAILVNQHQAIVTAAHQVSEQKSSVRPVLTGQPYEPPPALTNAIPSFKEPIQRWQERVSLIPGQLKRQLLKSYRGLSPVLIDSMIQVAGLDPDASTDSLTDEQWQHLWMRWQEWLQTLEKSEFCPGWTVRGYTVMGWGARETVASTQVLLDRYYTAELNRQEFSQLHHQLTQKLASLLAKLRLKAETFSDRLQQSDNADEYRQQADLLMAYLQQWQPGMQSITLNDFETDEPLTILLNPEKNAVQNAQSLYKRHQKLKRARLAVEPLLEEVNAEINYLQQVAAAVSQLDTYNSSEDLQTLEEIRDELICQGYIDIQEQPRRNSTEVSIPYSFQTPSGFELLIGRNNKQNDQLTFRQARDCDLWFHTQEIPGSHVLLRLQPGKVAEDSDLQFAADRAAYYSQGRYSDRVPVVYTEPKHIYKPKGAKPGMVIYKHERILWGRPHALL